MNAKVSGQCLYTIYAKCQGTMLVVHSSIMGHIGMATLQVLFRFVLRSGLLNATSPRYRTYQSIQPNDTLIFIYPCVYNSHAKGHYYTISVK